MTTSESSVDAHKETQPHVCPVWIGYLLASPLRKLLQPPEKLLGPHLKEGMRVLDFGSAMGFFTLPMARLVGPKGQVLAIDLQPKMLDKLMKRAAQAGLAERIEPRTCSPSSSGLGDERLDFALAMAVIHELPNPAALFADLHKALVEGGRLLVCEPAGHVSRAAFEHTLQLAVDAGFSVLERPSLRRSHTALLQS